MGIVGTLGNPREDTVQKSPHPKCHACLRVRAFTRSSREGLLEMFGDDKGKGAVADLQKTNTLEDAVNFIAKPLQFDPADRPSAEQALRDQFMSKLHEEDDEPTFRGILEFAQFEFE